MVVAPSIPLADSDTLVRVSGVSKKFCLSLKKSLWYGLCDMGRELTGRRRGSGKQGSEGDDRAGLRPKEFWAVNNVSFELKRGECLGLIGRNGAGKTTLLKMLNGLIKPDAGRIEMRGRVGALIALGAGFNPVLTGRENIYVNGSVLGLSRREIDAKLDEIIDFAEIGDFIDTPVQNYSSGMAVRLGFAVATALEPDILLLDEVLAVGDTAFRGKCFQRIGKLLTNTCVVFVSHDQNQVSRICNHVLWLKNGHVEYQGDVQEGLGLYRRANAVANPGQTLTSPHIRDVQFYPAADFMEWGADLELRLSFISDIPMNAGLFLIHLLREDQYISHTDLSKKAPPIVPGRNEWKIKIKNLQFVASRIDFNVSIFTEDNKTFIIQLLNAGHVEMRGNIGCGSAIRHEASIQLEQRALKSRFDINA